MSDSVPRSSPPEARLCTLVISARGTRQIKALQELCIESTPPSLFRPSRDALPKKAPCAQGTCKENDARCRLGADAWSCKVWRGG